MYTWRIWGWIDVEFRRILLGKTFLGALAALICLNCFFFLYQQTDFSGSFRAYPDIYHEVVEEYLPLSLEDGAAKAQAYYDYALESMTADRNWGTIPENSHRLSAVLAVQEQLEYLLSYDDYLANIQADVSKLQAVSLFSDPDSFAYKNTVKTAEDFGKMRDVPISFGHDLAVTKVFEDEWPDYSCALMVLVVCGLFLTERKEGLWPMIHASSGGRKRLAAKRIGILLAASWIATLLLFGSRILLSGWLFHGLDEWGRSIQSISLFYNVPREMTVGKFWLVYLAMKAMSTFLIGLVLWTILSAISDLGLAFCGTGLVLGIEFACTAILPSSMFAMLRYCNIFSYIRFFGVFSSYLNLSVFGFLISGSDLVLGLLIPLCILFSAAILVIAERKHPIAPANRLLSVADQFSKQLDKHTCGGSLLAQEAKKLFLRRKGALLLIALVVVMSQAEPPYRNFERWDMYTQYYQDRYSGPITQETVENLRSELETAQESDRVIALSLLVMEAENAQAGAWLVPTAPYEAIWSNNLGNYHRSTALMALLFLVLLLSPIASQERQSDMVILLRTAPGGRKKLFARKQLLILFAATAVWAIVYGAELVKTVQYWGIFRCLEAPAYSLAVFRELEWDASLGLTMGLYYGAKLIVLLAVGQICLFLSGLCGKNRDAILLCSGLILVPAGLAAIGSEMGEMLSALLPLGGVELFGDLLPYLITLAIGIAAGLLAAKRAA